MCRFPFQTQNKGDFSSFNVTGIQVSRNHLYYVIFSLVKYSINRAIGGSLKAQPENMAKKKEKQNKKNKTNKQKNFKSLLTQLKNYSECDEGTTVSMTRRAQVTKTNAVSLAWPMPPGSTRLAQNLLQGSFSLVKFIGKPHLSTGRKNKKNYRIFAV